jgi:GNAT superfamily N-acetyltransferase
MKTEEKKYYVNGLDYTIRSAVESDAAHLPQLRVMIDGETENMDREAGENLLSEADCSQQIKEDAEAPNHLFLIASVNNVPVGFARCEGSSLKRLAHKVEFGVCIRKDYWGHQIGKNLLASAIAWVDLNGIRRMELSVLETNKKAILLYMDMGFKVEGVLRNDKLLSDGNFYDTIVMGRVTSIN